MEVLHTKQIFHFTLNIRLDHIHNMPSCNGGSLWRSLGERCGDNDLGMNLTLAGDLGHTCTYPSYIRNICLVMVDIYAKCENQVKEVEGMLRKQILYLTSACPWSC